MGGLEVCGPCLGVILSETDPGRRRSLAGVARLPGPVVARLVDDPDAGVRARVAMRDDLDAATAARLADPRREPSPVVWRSLAGTRTGAARAESLVSTGDHVTRLILATNPATPQEMLERLAELGDAQVAATVDATRSGQAPDGAVIAQVLGARSIATRPLSSAPAGTAWPGEPASRTAAIAGDDTSVAVDADVDAPASHRGLVVGFAAALVLAVTVVAVLALGGGSGDQRGAASGTTRPTPSASTDPDHPTTGSAGSTVPTTAASTSTVVGAADRPVTLDLTMTAQQRRFCNTARIRLTFDASAAHVKIIDDAGRELWSGPWRSGATNTVRLVAPSDQLRAQVTAHADPDHFRPSGSVKGTFC